MVAHIIEGNTTLDKFQGGACGCGYDSVALRDEGLDLLVAVQHEFQHVLLVVLSPGPYRQLRDLQAGVTESRHVAVDIVLGGLHMVDAPQEILVAGDLVTISEMVKG